MGNSQQNTSGLPDHRHTDFEGNRRSIIMDPHIQRFNSFRSEINGRSMIENPIIYPKKDLNPEPAIKSRGSVPNEFRINIENLHIALSSNKKSQQNDTGKDESICSQEDHRFSNTEVESVGEEKLIETPNKQHMSPTKVRQKNLKHRIRLTSRSNSVKRNSIPGTFDTQKDYLETDHTRNKENATMNPKFENRYFHPPKAMQQRSECSLGPLPKDAIRVAGISNMYKNSPALRSSSASKEELKSSKPITLVFKKHMLNSDTSKVLSQGNPSVTIFEEGKKVNKFNHKDSLTKPKKPQKIPMKKCHPGPKVGAVDLDSEKSEGRCSQEGEPEADVMKEPPINVLCHKNGQTPEFPTTHRNSEGSVPSELHLSYCSRNSESYQRNSNPQMKIKPNNLKALDEKATGDMRELYDSNLPVHPYSDETYKNNYYDAYIDAKSGGYQSYHSQNEISHTAPNMELKEGNLDNSEVNPETELTPRANDRDSVTTREYTAFFLNQTRPVSENTVSQVLEGKSAERSQLTDRSDPSITSSKINSLVNTARNSAHHHGPSQQEQYMKGNSAETGVFNTDLLQASENNIQMVFQGSNEIRNEYWSIHPKIDSPKNKIKAESENFAFQKPGDLKGNSGVHVFLKLEPRNAPSDKGSSLENTQGSQKLEFSRKPTATFSLNDSEDQPTDDAFGIEVQPHSDFSVASSSHFFPAIVVERDSAMKSDKNQDSSFHESGVILRRDTEESKSEGKSMFNTATFAQGAKEFYPSLGANDHFGIKANNNNSYASDFQREGNKDPNSSQGSSKQAKETRFHAKENYTKASHDILDQNKHREVTQNAETSSEYVLNHTAPVVGPQLNNTESSNYGSQIQNRSMPTRLHLSLDEKQGEDSRELCDEADMGKISSKSSKASHDLEPLSESGIQPDFREPSSDFGQHRASFYLDITSEKSSPRHSKATVEHRVLNPEPAQYFYGPLGQTHELFKKNKAAETSEADSFFGGSLEAMNKLNLKMVAASSNTDDVSKESSKNLSVPALKSIYISRSDKEDIKPIEELQEARQRHACVQTERNSIGEDSSRSQPRKMFETYQEWVAYKNRLKSENKQDSTVPNSQRTGESASRKEGSINNDSMNVIFTDRYFQDRDTFRSNVLQHSTENSSKHLHTESLLKCENPPPHNRKLPDSSTHIHIRPSPKAEPFARISIALPLQNETHLRPEKDFFFRETSKVDNEPRPERRGSRESNLQQFQDGKRERRRSSSVIESRIQVGNSEFSSQNPQSQTLFVEGNNLFSPESVRECLCNSFYGSLSHAHQTAIENGRSPANEYCTFTPMRLESWVAKDEEKHSHLEPSTIHFSFEEPATMSMLNQLDGRYLSPLTPETQNFHLNPTPKPLINTPDSSKSSTFSISRAGSNPHISQEILQSAQQKAQPLAFKNQPVSDYERILQKAMKKNRARSKNEPKTSNAPIQKAKNKFSQPKLQEPPRVVEQSQRLVQNDPQNPQGALPVDDYVLSTEINRKNPQNLEQKSDHKFNHEITNSENELIIPISDFGRPNPPSRFFQNLEHSNNDETPNMMYLSVADIKNDRYEIEQKYFSAFPNFERGSVDENQRLQQSGNYGRGTHYLDGVFDLNPKNNRSLGGADCDDERFIQRNLNAKFEGFNVSAHGKRAYHNESPFERESRRQFQIADSSKVSINLPPGYLQKTPAKRTLQLRGEVIINDDQDHAFASLILGNSYHSPESGPERRRNNLDSAGRIRKNYMKEEWERIPRSSSAEQCNYSVAARAIQQSQSNPWRSHQEENENELRGPANCSQAFRNEINRLKNLTKQVLDNEFEVRGVHDPSQDFLHYKKEMMKENSMRLSNQNIFLNSSFAQGSGKPLKNEEPSNMYSYRRGSNHEMPTHSSKVRKPENTRPSAAQKNGENVFLTSYEGHKNTVNKLRLKLFEPENLDAPNNSKTLKGMTPFDAIDTETGDKNRRILREIRRKRDGSGEKRSNFITETLSKLSKRKENLSSKAPNSTLSRNSSYSKNNQSSAKTVKRNNIFAYPSSDF